MPQRRRQDTLDGSALWGERGSLIACLDLIAVGHGFAQRFDSMLTIGIDVNYCDAKIARGRECCWVHARPEGLLGERERRRLRHQQATSVEAQCDQAG